MANRRVALVIESSRGYGRDLLAGISDYGQVHGPWSFFVQERLLEDDLPRWLESWRGDGVIARCDYKSMLYAVQSLRVPCVDMRGNLASPLPVVRCDDRLAVRQAAEHLQDRGFNHLGFCGYATVNYSMRRLALLAEFGEEYGIEPEFYESPPPFEDATTSEIERTHVLFEPALADWIDSLPKPIGIIACNDIRGQQLLSTCRKQNVLIPEQVAVVGIDNDLALCEISDPPMSSVELDARGAGYHAAELLDEMMDGKDYSNQRFLIPPKGVVARPSTDVTAVDDPKVATAVRYIRLHASDGICVDDVVKQVPMSRRTLERRTKESIGSSINQLIVQFQLDRVKKLLAETEWSLMVIAEQCGFRHSEYLSTLFKRVEGVTPGEFRRRALENIGPIRGRHSDRIEELLPARLAAATKSGTGGAGGTQSL